MAGLFYIVSNLLLLLVNTMKIASYSSSDMFFLKPRVQETQELKKLNVFFRNPSGGIDVIRLIQAGKSYKLRETRSFDDSYDAHKQYDRFATAGYKAADDVIDLSSFQGKQATAQSITSFLDLLGSAGGSTTSVTGEISFVKNASVDIPTLIQQIEAKLHAAVPYYPVEEIQKVVRALPGEGWRAPSQLLSNLNAVNRGQVSTSNVPSSFIAEFDKFAARYAAGKLVPLHDKSVAVDVKGQGNQKALTIETLDPAIVASIVDSLGDPSASVMTDADKSRVSSALDFNFSKGAGIYIRLNSFPSQPNARLLFHGTSNQSLASIVKQGLIVPPHAAHGRLFGPGVYLTDNRSKASGYTAGYNLRFILVCEANLGHMYTIKSSSDRGSTSKGDSIFAPQSVTGFSANEYIVKNPKNVSIRYLLSLSNVTRISR